MPQTSLNSIPSEPSRSGRALKVLGVIFAVLMVFALGLFWIYGTDTHHGSRNSIWWSERGRNLIPPDATDTVEYTYSASNGGAHQFYHDTKTGLTYQDSAYW